MPLWCFQFPQEGWDVPGIPLVSLYLRIPRSREVSGVNRQKESGKEILTILNGKKIFLKNRVLYCQSKSSSQKEDWMEAWVSVLKSSPPSKMPSILQVRKELLSCSRSIMLSPLDICYSL